MLSRRSFFAAAAGAAAGTVGLAAAKPVGGVDLAAMADRTTIFIAQHDAGAGEFVRLTPVQFSDMTRKMMHDPFARIYSGARANDLTHEQLAANLDLPTIGEGKLPRNMTPAEKRKHDALVRECEKPIPIRETNAQFLRRMSLPCPGRLE